jgi:type II secretory pathway pseudopilin PulG
MNSRKSLPINLGISNERGSVLIELVVAAIIFAVVVASIAFYFVYHTGTINNGRAQLKLQRVGSLLMEEMARALREGKRTDLPDGGKDFKLMITYPDGSTRCYRFDEINKDIQGGPDYENLSPLKVLDDSHAVGGETYNHRIVCDYSRTGEYPPLRFEREGDRVIIRFTLWHDLDNGPGEDDLDISFGSTVKLRG